jgi:hypothetical protein
VYFQNTILKVYKGEDGLWHVEEYEPEESTESSDGCAGPGDSISSSGDVEIC